MPGKLWSISPPGDESSGYLTAPHKWGFSTRKSWLQPALFSSPDINVRANLCQGDGGGPAS